MSSPIQADCVIAACTVAVILISGMLLFFHILSKVYLDETIYNRFNYTMHLFGVKLNRKKI